MSYQIHPIHKSDIPDIRKLYQEVYPDDPHLVKDTTELEWLFTDPHQKNSMLGFIARSLENEPAGVIGFSLNQYQIEGKKVKGVIPVSWMVSPSHRGLLGIQLLKKVMNEGDFGFAIQGSTVAQQAYRAVRMKYIDAAHVYTKVLRPLAYIRSGTSLSPKAGVKAVVKAGYLLGRRRAAPGRPVVRLEPGSGSQGIHHTPVAHLAMIPDAKRTSWLGACPLVKMLSFTLYHKDQEKGPAICYISETKGIRRGRIVHLPYMGKETEAYRQAIALLEKELIAHSCCSVNALAMQSASRQALIKQGYKTYKTAARSFYVRDPGGLLEGVDLREWYFTFYESDKGYRGI